MYVLEVTHSGLTQSVQFDQFDIEFLTSLYNMVGSEAEYRLLRTEYVEDGGDVSREQVEFSNFNIRDYINI